MSLNEAAYALVQPLLDQPGLFGTSCHRRGGAWVVDCGVAAPGSPEAGLVMARAALGGLGEVRHAEAAEAEAAFEGGWPGLSWPAVSVSSAAPLAACLAAQYAGWRIATPDYFAMASGPIGLFQIAATSKRLSDCFWSFFAFLNPFREDISALGARQELLVVATVANELF